MSSKISLIISLSIRMTGKFRLGNWVEEYQSYNSAIQRIQSLKPDETIIQGSLTYCTEEDRLEKKGSPLFKQEKVTPQHSKKTNEEILSLISCCNPKLQRSTDQVVACWKSKRGTLSFSQENLNEF